MSHARTPVRIIAAAVALPLVALTVNLPGASAEADRKAASSAPGRFSGYGFDTCAAPSQSDMNVLRRESPFWGVGIYIGGRERSCKQPNLDRSWVRTQRAKGWKLFPIWVDRQSACADNTSLDTLISANTKRAKAQGVDSASDAVRAAKRLGLAKGSTLFLDVESWNITDLECNRSVFTYMSGFNQRLKTLGFKSGFYSAAATGIQRFDYVYSTSRSSFTWPTSLWIAHGDGRANTSSSFLRGSYYRHQRAKQYDLDTTRTYGSVTLSLDLNAIDIGGGIQPPRKAPSCGVTLDFRRYHVLHQGMTSSQVKAAQCLLKQKGSYRGKVSGHFNRATARAVGRFQAKYGLTRTRNVGTATWMALHSAGSPALLKRGSATDRVRSLQRALTVALGKQVKPTGMFMASTTSAVRSYQRKVGLAANGIVGTSTWKALKAGDR